ncbi:VOC family protein [Bradyrhizobium betae]|uniref:VOC domain-containing protein n=1 Tax=Bradyrhizobium betae TaxID=244734 RepID=A0A4Q1VNG5_9BRAD|nr:VOC family protein [Bradyrhizobium betae]RXT54241.1 hypothetical protein B5V03_02020 [Bradyrhizobium betae]
MSASGPKNLAYIRLGVSHLDAAAAFVSDVVGLQAVVTNGATRTFRSDQRKHTLSLFVGAASGCGIEVTDHRDLDSILVRLREHKFEARLASDQECQERFVRAALITQDSGGLPVDVVFAPAHSGRRYYGPRDAGVRGLHSVGLRSVNIERDLLLWTTALGLKVRDRVGGIAYLGCDATHHRVALYPSKRSGLLYVTFEVEGFDNIMQNFYHMQEHQVRVLQGPGRETASGQAFVRFEGPDRQMFAFGCEMAIVDEQRHHPRQFELDRYTLCGWGSECQDSPELIAHPDRQSP